MRHRTLKCDAGSDRKQGIVKLMMGLEASTIISFIQCNMHANRAVRHTGSTIPWAKSGAVILVRCRTHQENSIPGPNEFSLFFSQWGPCIQLTHLGNLSVQTLSCEFCLYVGFEGLPLQSFEGFVNLLHNDLGGISKLIL